MRERIKKLESRVKKKHHEAKILILDSCLLILFFINNFACLTDYYAPNGYYSIG